MSKLQKFTCVLAFTLSLPVGAADTGGYLGIALGRSDFQLDVDENQIINQAYAEIPIYGTEEVPLEETLRRSDFDDKEATAWKLYGGYKFNPYFALEAAYVDFGKISGEIGSGARGLSTQPTGSVGSFIGSQRTELDYNAQVLAVSARGSLPIGKWFELFAKLGPAYYISESERAWFADGIQGGDSSYSGSFSTSNNETGVTWFYGLGAGLNIGNHWGINLEYESYLNVKYDFGGVTGEDNINMLSLGVDYSF